MVAHYRQLVAWQKAMDLVVMTYKLSRLLPESERFGLVAQMQRSAVSIPANIAEGHDRRYAKEYRRFLSIASASLAELETHLLLSSRLDLIANEAVEPVISHAGEVGKIIRGIDRAIARKADA